MLLRLGGVRSLVRVQSSRQSDKGLKISWLAVFNPFVLWLFKRKIWRDFVCFCPFLGIFVRIYLHNTCTNLMYIGGIAE
nr:MAG TPA: hypothetical protein [Caudoviricetes sp.]